MGKGKGSRKGIVSLVKSGNSIVELRYCRLGLILKLYKYISVRCSFKVHFLFSIFKNISRMGLTVLNYNIKLNPNSRIKSKRYIDNRLLDIYTQYSKSSDVKRYGFLKKHYAQYTQPSIYFRYRLINENRSICFLKFIFRNRYKYNYCYNIVDKYSRRLWRKKARIGLLFRDNLNKKFYFFFKKNTKPRRYSAYLKRTSPHVTTLGKLYRLRLHNPSMFFSLCGMLHKNCLYKSLGSRIPFFRKSTLADFIRRKR